MHDFIILFNNAKEQYISLPTHLYSERLIYEKPKPNLTLYLKS